MVMQQRVSNVAPFHRRQAGNALLAVAARLAALTDELDDLRSRGQAVSAREKARINALALEAIALKDEYRDALSRYRAVAV